jgi:hypothetical protein
MKQTVLAIALVMGRACHILWIGRMRLARDSVTPAPHDDLPSLRDPWHWAGREQVVRRPCSGIRLQGYKKQTGRGHHGEFDAMRCTTLGCGLSGPLSCEWCELRPMEASSSMFPTNVCDHWFRPISTVESGTVGEIFTLLDATRVPYAPTVNFKVLDSEWREISKTGESSKESQTYPGDAVPKSWIPQLFRTR